MLLFGLVFVNIIFISTDIWHEIVLEACQRVCRRRKWVNELEVRAEGNLYFFYFLKGFEKFFFLRKQIKFLKPFSYILNINIRIFQENGSHILDISYLDPFNATVFVCWVLVSCFFLLYFVNYLKSFYSSLISLLAACGLIRNG